MQVNGTAEVIETISRKDFLATFFTASRVANDRQENIDIRSLPAE